MNKKFLLNLPIYLLMSPVFSGDCNELEARGNLEIQERYFFNDPLSPSQHSSQLSMAASPELFWSINKGKDAFEFIISARVDQHDEERTHTDIREFSWTHVSDNWETRIGIRRDFWGVTEFQHLVDIINQTDSVEDIDNEDKLGQPMINLSVVTEIGIIDLYAMPFFRERTFAGKEGRFHIPLLNPDRVLYESDDKDKNLDWAFRWSHTMGMFDVAISWFEGTSRDPDLVLVNSELLPYYRQISQLGGEFQANYDTVLWKLEIINRNYSSHSGYWAFQGGFEYSHYQVLGSAADLGWLVEYGWDERGTDSPSVFQNDLFMGNRLAFNDSSSTEILFGFSYDTDFRSTSALLEVSRRLGNNLKLSIDARFFDSNKAKDPVYLFRRDNHVQLTMQYYY